MYIYISQYGKESVLFDYRKVSASLIDWNKIILKSMNFKESWCCYFAWLNSASKIERLQFKVSGKIWLSVGHSVFSCSFWFLEQFCRCLSILRINNSTTPQLAMVKNKTVDWFADNSWVKITFLTEQCGTVYDTPSKTGQRTSTQVPNMTSYQLTAADRFWYKEKWPTFYVVKGIRAKLLSCSKALAVDCRLTVDWAKLKIVTILNHLLK